MTDDPEIQIGDLLCEASFGETANAFDLADFFEAEGRKPADPVELLSKAISLLVAERRRYILRELERGPKPASIEQQLDAVLPTMDQLDQFYDRTIRGGWNGVFARLYRQGVLVHAAADVLILVECTNPRERNGNFDHTVDGRRIKRFATKNGYDPERFAAISYVMLIEFVRRSTQRKGRSR